MFPPPTPSPVRQTSKISRVAMSRGTMLPYLGYFSSRKYQRRSGPSFFGTQTRPPSPRADSRSAALVLAGDGGGVHLDELAVGVACACW